MLGLAAENIHVGAVAGPEPPAKASTVPWPSPSNPSPNTEVAAKHSNGEPSFPSGDNQQRRQC
jgi:hypothetical protein